MSRVSFALTRRIEDLLYVQIKIVTIIRKFCRSLFYENFNWYW